MYTKYSIKEIKEKLKLCLSYERYIHSIGTMEKSMELAERFNLNIEKALKSYRRWSEVRIILLLVVAVFNISLYYWTMDTTGLLCGGMAVLATMLCIPGRRRMLSELDLQKTEGEDL